MRKHIATIANKLFDTDFEEQDVPKFYEFILFFIVAVATIFITFSLGFWILWGRI